MLQRIWHAAGAAGLVAAAVSWSTAALAALLPYWQSAREIGAIIEDPRVHDALKYVEPFLSVTFVGPDGYELRTARCRVTVTIVDTPQEEGMVGPRQFDLEIGPAECQ